MVSTMKLSASSQCVKYLMFIFNLFFVITGIILLSIGSAIHGLYNENQHFLDNKFFSVPTLLIIVGFIIFFIAFFGCCGAVRENYCMVVTFAGLMVVIFILELFAGISGYVLKAQASDLIQTKMRDTMGSYNNSTEISTIWDNLQKDFKCCGINNSSDWNKAWNNDDLPMSCCPVPPGTIGNTTCNSHSLNIYEDGCLSAFGTFVKDHAVHLGGVAIGIAFLQFLGIWFSIFLARSIRNSYESV